MPANRGPRRYETRDAAIHLRVSRRQRALIDRAAEALGMSRSAFMREVALREADCVLLDRRFFLLDEKAYLRFTEVQRPATSARSGAR